MGAISYEIFEIIMDKLEKEWFNLVSCPRCRRMSAEHADQAHTTACFSSAGRRLKVLDM
jgi:hypothetical protein